MTKFVQLKPLKSKTVEEVAYNVIEIFLMFDSPTILQSDNGHEFADNVIKEVCSIWDRIKMTCGRPHHSQSQGSVEMVNHDIRNLLIAWLNDN